MGLAPVGPLGEERDRRQQFESDVASNDRRRGPLRFEEGIATDTDVPNDFRVGAYSDTMNNRQSWPTKSPGETMRERTHMGSSTWIEAPSMLGEFVQGAHVGQGGPAFEMERESEGRKNRPNRACVTD
jgi:hypothetical protein